MVTNREYRHIIVPDAPWRSRESYTKHPGGGGGKKPLAPKGGRSAHGKLLGQAMTNAVKASEQRRADSPFVVKGATPGMYLEFKSFDGWELALSGFENLLAKDPHRNIEVVAVAESQATQAETPAAKKSQYATVFVPDGQVKHFLEQLEKYTLASPKKKNEKRYEDAYDRVAKVRLATLRALWTDAADAYPSSDDVPIWWELWLRRTDGGEMQRLQDFADQAHFRLGSRRIQFEDRIVTLAYASSTTLAASLDVLGDLAELQRAKETAAFFVNESATEQAQWTLDLAGRVEHAGKNAPAVCILDTGVNGGHPLLEGALATEDCHTCDPQWRTDDHDGHGTGMAGLALYGDLVPHLAGTENFSLRHRLESVKILPPKGENEPELYAAITAEATSRPEIQAPNRRRIYSMAITTTDTRDRGQPTSWSAALDALAAGRSFDPNDNGLSYLDDESGLHSRLFVVSAGNVDGVNLNHDHLAFSETEPVHDPAQAWNILTVGAHTEKVLISDPAWSSWSPVAEKGELSPWSSTSVLFQSQWPIKPEVVFEGGNVVHNAAGAVDFPCDDLSLLTTHFKPAEKLLVSTWATSPATAQAAQFCARILGEYPELWPETIRALVVHSAEWTAPMRAHLGAAGSKKSRALLVRRYGYGVPNLERALKSASNAVTLISQDSIRPFEAGKTREIHFHDLPWPLEALTGLGDVPVRVRVTLSYFVEPNPGRRGWQKKHRYQSHGLRFEVSGPTESRDEFRKRLNNKALDEGEKRSSEGADNDGWFLGPTARNGGSVHSDVFVGLAADIAARGLIAIYPVTGWWKELKKRDRSEYGARYALVVSIETDEVKADLWTPVSVAVENAVRVAVEVES